MITVCVATAISLFREGFLRVLNENRGILVTTTAARAEEVLHSCREGRPEVLLLDGTLPGMKTTALLRRLKQRGYHGAVLLFGDLQTQWIGRARQAGIAGALHIHDDAEEYVRAIHSGAEAPFYLSTHMAGLQSAETPEHSPGSDLEERLTPTELQIFRALMENQTSQEIAASMFISYRTVQKHRANITHKLQLTGSNALLAFALRYRSESE
jgi:two-component system nitrate/nitrite response regulator NarL